MKETEIISKAIKYAFEIGDKDECFYKHVGYTLNAIYENKGYQNPEDYETPGCDYDIMEEYEDNNDDSYEDSSEYQEKLEILKTLWKDVEELCKKVGSEKFAKMVKECKNTEYFEY